MLLGSLVPLLCRTYPPFQSKIFVRSGLVGGRELTLRFQMARLCSLSEERTPSFGAPFLLFVPHEVDFRLAHGLALRVNLGN